MRYKTMLFTIQAVLLLSACGESKKDNPPPYSYVSYPDSVITEFQESPERDPEAGAIYVMVIDNNFDINADVLKDKVAAAYTIVCGSKKEFYFNSSTFLEGPLPFSRPNQNLTSKRQELIERAAHPENCYLKPGITHQRRSIYDLVIDKRERLNEILRYGKDYSKEPETFNLIMEITHPNPQIKLPPPHGFEVSQLIAHQNPQVRFVLIEAALDWESVFPFLTEAKTTAEDIKVETKLLQEIEIKNAFIKAPYTQAEIKMAELIKKYNVVAINQSYGEPARQRMQEFLRKKNIRPIDENILKNWFEARGQILSKRRKYSRTEGNYSSLKFIEIQGAGNDGTLTNTLSDITECTQGDNWHYIVGALNSQNEYAEFTNRGDCVDIYAPGTQILTENTKGFLNVVRGTSFSTPLITREFVLALKNLGDFEAARHSVFGFKGTKLQTDHFPEDLFVKQ